MVLPLADQNLHDEVHSHAVCNMIVLFVIEAVLFVIEAAFSALTLLVGCQEEHLARKNLSDEVLALLSSGAKCK